MQISDTGGGAAGSTYFPPPPGNPGAPPVKSAPGLGTVGAPIGPPAPAQPTPGAPQPTYFQPPGAPAPFFNPPAAAPTPTQPAQPPPAAPPPSGTSTAEAPAPSGPSYQPSQPIIQKPIANSSLWGGAPDYESRLYANMYSGNPGGVPSSLPMQQLNQGNPAQGVGQSYLPSYFQGNLSGMARPDTNQVNTGLQQANLLTMHATPQQMSYFRGAGG